MARIVKNFDRFAGGIADFNRESAIPDAHAFSRAVDFRINPKQLALLPVAIKESGNVITDFLKWGETYNLNLTSYLYGNTGNLYSRTSAGVHTFLRQVASSHGNGLVYSAEDDFLYYSADKVVGRYGPLSSTTPTFVDNFFGSLGGVPLNTNSLSLVSASSQYADRASTASLSITGDFSFSAQINPTTLPASGSSMVLASKWNVNGGLQSYLVDIAGVSGYFGSGSDGALTISTATTEAPIDASCTGTTGTTTLSATNASFAANQIILIWQTQGTNAGSWQRNTIASYTAGTITLSNPLNTTYGTGAQVRVLKQYTNVTINSGINYIPKAWNGTTGGILAFIASGTVNVTGNITDVTTDGAGVGFRGGAVGIAGEGYSGTGSSGRASNANGGGGASGAGGGGGGGLAGVGLAGGGTGGNGGGTAGSADLTTLVMGGGGGGAIGGGAPTTGAPGGGCIFITATTLTVTGSINANGSRITDSVDNVGGAGGGGSILMKCQTATLGTGLITASGGVNGITSGYAGGNGGAGRIHLDYYTSYTGTTTPTLDVIKDNTLVTNTSYQLRLTVSSTGSNSETLAMVTPLTAGIWQQVGISWSSSASTATFYLNAVSLGTVTGTLTAINSNSARFSVGCSFDSSGNATNFYNGLINDLQIYNATQTQAQFFASLTMFISTTTPNLQAYYKFADYTDSTANGNNLTAENSPTLSTNVPFPSPTTRLDQDLSQTTSGFTYTPLTAISEAASDRTTFTPLKDPQKSMSVLVATKGTGAWTITIHDAQNTLIASSTITNTNMTTGYVEFTFNSLWRPLTNFTNVYHAHITSTVADGTITCGTSGACETISYRTYFQFLVTDTNWHPMTRFLNFWVVGNEKWVGKYEATLYDPNRVALGADWKVRCFGKYLEYLVIGVVKNTTNITDADVGRLYFWDGYSPTYNFPVEVPQGGVNAILGVGAKLYVWAGYNNQMLEYQGSFLATDVQKVKFLPKMERNKYSETYPQAVVTWKGLVRWGASANSNSTTLPRGVYSYGKSSVRYEDILSCDYLPSTGNSGTSVSIGLLMVVNQRLLIGWQDGTGFGMDYVDSTTTTFGQGTIEQLIEDEEAIWKSKEALNIKAVFMPLNSGDSIALKYKLDDASAWSVSTTTTNVGDTSLVLPIPNGREHEVQFACDFSTTNTVSPIIKGFGLEVNTLEEEQGIGVANE